MTPGYISVKLTRVASGTERAVGNQIGQFWQRLKVNANTRFEQCFRCIQTVDFTIADYRNQIAIADQLKGTKLGITAKRFEAKANSINILVTGRATFITGMTRYGIAVTVQRAPIDIEIGRSRRWKVLAQQCLAHKHTALDR